VETMESVADYRILGPAGAGATGTFYFAVPPIRLGLTADRVLLKVVTGALDDDAFRRVSRELRAFAAVSSPYLVQLYDAGQDGSTCYYSMEHLPVGSLAAPTRPLARREVLRAVAHAARAAHALHEAGLAHRDIQPASVLLHDSGAKLADLGLAQVLNPDQTVTGLSGLDSVEYIDPAVMAGGRVTRAADVFALGATLHRALSGEGLYGYLPANEPLVAVRRVLTTEPTIAAQLSSDERSVVERCIAPDPADRWRNADALATAIDELTGAEG
jgi:serine/threonine protein kinase